ncbi:MAG TPA: ArsA family ATPase [Ardenticatenaceae bacterium]|nr:ArsA family ATPase [Ardenticatenaceae bacterium]
MSGRVILITGKGGVGKSSVAAATALTCARQGHSTAVVSIDSAHNLSDIFDRRVGDDLVPVAPRLDAIEINLNREIRERWSDVTDFVRLLAANHPAVNTIVAEEVAVLPGMEEIFGLLRLQTIAESGRYDVLVVDTPPTGDTMKVLRLPDVLNWYMKLYHPLQRALLRSTRPIVQRFNVPVPDDGTLDEVGAWLRDVQRLSAWLSDAGRVSARLVMTPDRVALFETQRAFSTISLFGVRVDALVVNKVLPAGHDDPFLRSWTTQQEQVLDQVERDFSGLPRFYGAFQPEEPVGLDRLGLFADDLFGDTPIAPVLLDRALMEVTETTDEIRLHLFLPFLERDQFKLHVSSDDVYLQVQTQRRQIPLPAALLDRRFLGATYADGTLTLRFNRRRESPTLQPLRAEFS